MAVAGPAYRLAADGRSDVEYRQHLARVLTGWVDILAVQGDLAISRRRMVASELAVTGRPGLIAEVSGEGS
ncbi:hypothetical protein [Amycolatopsis sp. PS_44_ISF1]|uniref:hypothetical protein n=1 Tax=Amycolatopsis sp. PS_44_ISF1 TaxID=2974917 RepID=UPI0028DFE3F6|nr:hypothetical protein [Amycolatopsis sp. PS_44_ISF1]MDT8915545.1 hypothetical protein [Amycolatopsis sp. PS_44_ISF1]